MTIFLSLEMQIEGLQIFSKHQKQRSKEEEICDILSFFLRKKFNPFYFQTPYFSHF